MLTACTEASARHSLTHAPLRAAPRQELGWYNPLSKETSLDAPNIKKWLEVGAQPSETVGNLLRKAMILTTPARVRPRKEVPAGADADAKKKKK